MRWVFDIDGTLCDTNGTDYMNSEPDESMIILVNMLYDKGDYITIQSARGSSSGIDWYQKTKDQLDKWGLKYHKLILNKPAGDIYVDDASIKPEEFRNII